MNFYCPDCDWVGYEEEMIGDDAEDACPGCGSVRVYEEGESDDNEENNKDYLYAEISALRSQL